MFDIKITLLFLGLPIGLLAFAYIVFPRKTKNFFMNLLPAWKKRYVICHLTYQAGLVDVFFVIPNKLGLTNVGKFDYLLNEKYAALVFNKRVHYVLNENDSIPKTFIEHTKEEVIFQTAEIKNALENNVMEYLFSKKKELLIIGLFIIAIIATLAIAYNIVNVNELKTLVQNPPTPAIEYVTTTGK